MFQFRRFPSYTYGFSIWCLDMTPDGLLHSEICGSMPTYGSPQLIAVSRVLLRLPVPRHSPCALCSLTMCSHKDLLWISFSLPFRNCSYYLKQIFQTWFSVITLDFCLLSLYSVFKVLWHWLRFAPSSHRVCFLRETLAFPSEKTNKLFRLF